MKHDSISHYRCYSMICMVNVDLFLCAKDCLAITISYLWYFWNFDKIFKGTNCSLAGSLWSNHWKYRLHLSLSESILLTN